MNKQQAGNSLAPKGDHSDKYFMSIASVNIKIFMKVEDDVKHFDLKRCVTIQEKWNAHKQRKKLQKAILPSNNNKERKM